VKLVLAFALALMVVGAIAGYLIWKTPAAAIGFSLVGLGATIAGLCLAGLEPDSPK
jgi:hypothetical protein